VRGIFFPAAAQHKLISNTTETRRRFHQPEKEICGRDFRPRDVVALCHQRTTTPISFVSFVSQQEKQTSSFWLARLFAVFQLDSSSSSDGGFWTDSDA
jgi:hypothetical protein